MLFFRFESKKDQAMPFPGADVLFATDKRFATARPVIVGPREKAQPESVENDGRSDFIVSGLLFTMKLATVACRGPNARSLCAP